MGNSIVSEFTRPADTNGYGVCDVVGPSTEAGTIGTLSGVAQLTGGEGYFTSARLVKGGVAGGTSTANAMFRVFFYDTPFTPQVDNAQHYGTWGNRNTQIGWLDFNMQTSGQSGTLGDASYDFITNLNMKFRTLQTSRDVYWVLTTLGSYTPVASENFMLEMNVDRRIQ